MKVCAYNVCLPVLQPYVVSRVRMEASVLVLTSVRVPGNTMASLAKMLKVS